MNVCVYALLNFKPPLERTYLFTFVHVIIYTKKNCKHFERGALQLIWIQNNFKTSRYVWNTFLSTVLVDIGLTNTQDFKRTLRSK